ncbi:MAG: YbjN domain-containing protein [Candidatus Latescibacterota bacterium]
MATQVTFDDVVKYFRQQDLHFGIGERNTITLTVRGENGEYQVLVYYPWEREIILTYVNYSFTVPGEKRSEILELIARINWGLLFGTCEYQPDTGILRFRSLMLTDDASLNSAQFTTMLSTAVANAERYAPAFKAVLSGKATIARALSRVEES